MRLELRTALSREVSALVRRGDAALGRRDFGDPDHDLVSLPLYREELLTVSQKRLVEAGFGLGMMPRSSVEEELRLGTLRELHIAATRREVPVVLRTGAPALRIRWAWVGPAERNAGLTSSAPVDYRPLSTSLPAGEDHDRRAQAPSPRRSSPGAHAGGREP